tara:strand:- start:628 stop:768 length:141 start_codon:yes stop_codon:yes gene_type:complete
MSTTSSEMERTGLIKEGQMLAERICDILLRCRENHEMALAKKREAA